MHEFCFRAQAAAAGLGSERRPERTWSGKNRSERIELIKGKRLDRGGVKGRRATFGKRIGSLEFCFCVCLICERH